MTAISVGSAYQCVLLGSGGVECWGDDQSNELGFTSSSPGVYTPTAVPGLGAAQAIAAAQDRHTCAVMADGSVQCWGSGTVTQSVSPVAVSGVSGAATVAAGYGYNCALLASGNVRCWQQ